MSWLRLIFCLALGVSSGLFARAEAGTTVNLGPLAPAVRQIFDRSCAECHDVAQRSRPKGGFGYVLDMERLKDSDYVVAGAPDKSDLYLYLIEPDPDLLMPPPDSDAPALTAEEVATVHAWIKGLLNTQPEAAAGLAAADLTPPSASPVEPTSFAIESSVQPKSGPSWLTVFARTHPMVVHFPIALLVMAGLVECLGVVLRRQKEWLPVVRWSLAIASISALLAVAAGWLLVDQEGYKDATVFLHRWLGVATAAVSCLGWLLLERSVRTGSVKLRRLACLVILAGAVLVSITGHTGGELVYGEGYPFN